MTEQSEITVTFKITELLHLYDQLIISRDHFDNENVQICDYLCDRIWEQVPEFDESEDFYKPIIPKDYKSNF
jgi:hypothetical protein